jgi:predicted DsbA family dithiol-disulfide isomerase
VKVEVYSDLSCPWCYLANRNLRSALAGFGDEDVDVVSHPYQIDGEEPAAAVPMLDFLAAKYGRERASRMSDAVTRKGATLGVEFRNAAGYSVNTLQGHRLLWMVGREYGWRTRATVEDALYAQWFTHGGDVADPDVLVECAAAAGVPRRRAAEYVGSTEDTATVRARIAAARAEVSVVPTVVLAGSARLANYHETADYLAALRRTPRPEAQ